MHWEPITCAECKTNTLSIIDLELLKIGSEQPYFQLRIFRCSSCCFFFGFFRNESGSVSVKAESREELKKLFETEIRKILTQPICPSF